MVERVMQREAINDIPVPDISNLIVEDGAPVDSLFSERQMNLLVDSLYASWSGPGEGRPFAAMANVGLYSAPHVNPLVPDVLVSLDVKPPEDVWPKENRCYLMWVYGKPPDLVVEIVSNREGDELGNKLLDYARIGIAYYIVYDPDQQISNKVLRILGRRQTTYAELTDRWFADIGIGLTLWHGEYRGVTSTWLRWCNQEGELLPTGKESAEQERERAEAAQQQAEQERLRAERLAEKLRALGVDPDAK
jgi:hypothetical protein